MSDSSKPIRVAFNARLLREPTLRGWNRYTINLLERLPALGVDLVLLTDGPLHESHLGRLPRGSYVVRNSGAMRYLAWEQRWVPRQCRADGVDLVHCPLNYGLPWFSPCPRVLTLHDAIGQIYYGGKMTWLQRWRPRSLYTNLLHWASRARAEHVITVSEHAAGDLHSFFGIPRSRITVTSEAADPQFHRPLAVDERDAVRQRHQLERPYFFYVGGWEERKNIPFLVDAFAKANVPGAELVLAGGRDDQRRLLTERAAALGIGDRLRLLGWVADEDMPALYAEAVAFVYTSEYEGFGLQLCEAMACGCPVLAANRTSLPEVLGTGGETFGLESVDQLVGLMRRVANEPGYRAELAARAIRRSSDFDWSKTAEQTVEVYRRLLAKA